LTAKIQNQNIIGDAIDLIEEDNGAVESNVDEGGNESSEEESKVSSSPSKA
jgi:hypothetical protein